MPLSANFVEKRRGDRRRGNLLELLKSGDGYRAATEQPPQIVASRACIANLAFPAELEEALIRAIDRQPALKLIGDARHPGGESPSDNHSRTRLQIHGDSREMQQLLQRLKQAFPGSGIRYWIASITDSGEL